MIATVLLDIQTNLLVGHLMALSAWTYIGGKDRPVFNRFFWRAMAWSLFCFVPVAGYFYYAYPDWSMVYMTGPAARPAWLGPCIFAAYSGGMFFGYLTAQYLLGRALILPFAASLLYALFLNVAMFAATWDQYTHLGTTAQYLAGQAVPIDSDGAFMLRMNIGGAIMVLSGIAVLAMNLRDRVPEDEVPQQ